MNNDQVSHENDLLSTKLQFDVVEDVAAELEDFIYLARLGCFEEANDIYESVLKRHAPRSYPILAAYLEMLVDNGSYSQALMLLESIALEQFSEREGICLELFKLLSLWHIDQSKHMILAMTSPRFDSTADQIFLEVDDGRINHVDNHILELCFSLYMLEHNNTWSRSVIPFLRNLPVRKVHQIMQHRLVNKCYWEAYKYFRCAAQLYGRKTTEFYESFIRDLCYHQPSFARHVVELAVLVDSLEHLAVVMAKNKKVVWPATHHFIATAVAAEGLFAIFFEDDSICRGSQDLKMRKAIGVWLDLLEYATSDDIAVHRHLMDILDEGVILPIQLREMVDRVKAGWSLEVEETKSASEKNALRSSGTSSLFSRTEGLIPNVGSPMNPRLPPRQQSLVERLQRPTLESGESNDAIPIQPNIVHRQYSTGQLQSSRATSSTEHRSNSSFQLNPPLPQDHRESIASNSMLSDWSRRPRTNELKQLSLRPERRGLEHWILSLEADSDAQPLQDSGATQFDEAEAAKQQH